MGNLGLYVETARKRSRGLRELFLDQGEGIDPKELIAGLTVEERELFEERAGIMELEGGLSREEAELEALREILTAGTV
jgi:hypothetical protein